MAFDPNNPAASGMVLTWDDEFTSSAGQLSADNVASRTKWSDHVWWTPAPSNFPGSIHDGVLDLQPGAEINTINSSAQGWSQKYGYFEARIKFAPSNDVEQGFFMMSQAHAQSAPAPSSELDIVETSPHDPTHVLDTLHRQSGQPGEAQNSATGGNPLVSVGTDTTQGFHTYGALWDPNSSSITWYFDGKVTMVQPKYDTTDGAAMFMDLLNTAGTGNMQVDYVRAWQFSGQNPTAVTPDPVSAPFGQAVTNGSLLPGASVTPTPAPSAGPVSADGTVVSGTSGTIVSDAHNVFAINAGGQITENGAVMTITGAVTELAYHNHTLYQEATSKNLWWSFNEATDAWTQTSNPLVTATPSPSPAPTPSGGTAADPTITLHVSGDHWAGHAGGDPQFIVLVDGHQVGGVQTVTAVHDSNQWQDITVNGTFSNAQEIDVKFINDQYGGSHAQDVNLYVDSITVGGQKYFGAAATNNASQGYHDASDPNAAVMAQNGTLAFHVASATPTPTAALASALTPAPAPAPAPVFMSSSFNDGSGHDVFVFNTAAATGKDIATFDVAADILDLAPALKAAGYSGSDPIADHVVTLAQLGTDSTAVKIDPTGQDPAHGVTLVTLDHVLPQDVHAANIWH